MTSNPPADEEHTGVNRGIWLMRSAWGEPPRANCPEHFDDHRSAIRVPGREVLSHRPKHNPPGEVFALLNGVEC